jgi:hypothetical protein
MFDINTMAEGLMPGPDSTYLRYFYDSSHNQAASEAAGRALYDSVLMVDVISPGQQVSQPRIEIERIFSDQSRAALPTLPESIKSFKYREYAEYTDRFKSQEAGINLGGTPLKMWPRMDRPTVAMLASSNIFTVEALAAISDTNLQSLGFGGRELREQAIAWLDNANATGNTSKYVAENEKLKLEVQTLIENNRNLTALLEAANKEIKGKKAAGSLV